MKTYLLLFILGLLFLPGYAQENTPGPAPASYTVPSVWRVTFLGIGVQNETRLGPKTTLATRLGFVLNGAVEDRTINPSSGPVRFSFSLAPMLQSGVRHFYNFERRLQKQKSIRYNSGNYVSAQLRYVTPPIWRNVSERAPLTPVDGLYAEALWGLQRTYKGNIFLNLLLGAGVGRNGAYPAIDFALGYSFPNRKI
jgi:hypothetical protein